MAPGEPVISPDEIRMQMGRVLSSKDFDASDRNRRFPEYVVDEAMAGRADRIKAYSIATDVFGRHEDFDPQQDAIVRIEAGRMRRSLDRYYLTSGLSDPIRISMPVGSYVPAFARYPAVADRPEPSGEGSHRTSDAEHDPVHRPTIRVCGFLAEGASGGLDDLAGGVTRRVIAALARFTDLAVVGPDCPEQAVDFVLSGAVAAVEGKLVAEVLLRDTFNGHYIWSDTFESGSLSDDRMAHRIAIADRIVGAVGQPSGVLFSYLAQDSLNGTPAASESFDSVMQFHGYWRSFDPGQYDQVREALERTIVRDPHYAEAFACLSQLYSNAIRFKYKGVVHDLHPLQRAISLAKQAVHLSPGSSRAYLSLGIAFWFDGQIESGLDALRKSRELNPNDMEVVAELGMRYCARANWDEGVPLIDAAYRRNPALPGAHRMGLSMWHYWHDRFEQALLEARNVEMPGVIYPYIMIAISAHRLGRDREAKAALGSVLALSPEYGKSVAADLDSRNVAPDLAAVLIKGLKDAGLACQMVSGPTDGKVPVRLRGKSSLPLPRPL